MRTFAFHRRQGLRQCAPHLRHSCNIRACRKWEQAPMQRCPPEKTRYSASPSFPNTKPVSNWEPHGIAHLLLCLLLPTAAPPGGMMLPILAIVGLLDPPGHPLLRPLLVVHLLPLLLPVLGLQIPGAGRGQIVTRDHLLHLPGRSATDDPK